MVTVLVAQASRAAAIFAIMGFHKHGPYSFSIAVQKMSLIGGDSFVADVTALRHHQHTGRATILELPILVEEYGDTAQAAEGRAALSLRRWLDTQTERGLNM